MADNCLLGIAADFTGDVCTDPPQAGLEQVLYLLNYDDIDRGATTFNANKNTCTALVRKAGKIGYKLPGFKQSNSVGWTIVPKELAPDAYSHNLSGVIHHFTADARDNINRINADNRVVAVVEKKFKGPSLGLAFEIYGYDSGLGLGGDTNFNVNENSGAVILQLITVENEEEPRLPYIWLETDYNTTKTAFDALGTP